MSRPKRIITQEEIKNICQEYLGGKSIKSLQRETKLQWKNIKQILLNNNIKVLNHKESKFASCALEEKEYFSNLNELECYVLGLIFGDGCVHYNEEKYKYALTITSNDLDILESARILFGEQFSIKKRKTSNAYNFVINSKFLCKELITKFKLQSPKSNSLVWPKLPKEMYSFFISGLLSTDGCIEIDSRRGHRLNALIFSYSSNCKEFIESLQFFLMETLNVTQTKIKVNKTKRKNINYAIRYGGAQAKIILDYIYNNTIPLTRCARKYDKFQKLLNQSLEFNNIS